MVLRFEQKLLQFIEKYHNAKVMAILEVADIPFNLVDSSGNSLLHYAAKYDNTVIAKYLINSGTLVDVQNKDGETPLILALKHCYSIFLPRLLIEANADINICDKAGNTPLQLVIYKFMNYELWKTVLKKLEVQFSFDYEEITNVLIRFDCNLQDIMFVGCTEVTKIMLERGCNVNESDEIGRVALHGAVSFMHLGNVKLLIEYGANVNLQDADGLAAMAYVRTGHKNVNETLEIIKALMDAGAKMYLPEKTGNYEIMQMRDILKDGSKAMIRLLMQYDIDLNTKAEFDETALHVLAQNHHPRILEELPNEKIDVDVYDFYNCTPLEFALENPSSVKFLLEHGAKVDVTGNGLIISLIENCSDELIYPDKFYADSIILLLRYGASIDKVTSNGQTMFDVALDYDRLVLIKPILAHLAMLQTIGNPLPALISRQIRDNKMLKNLFDFYVHKMKKMKKITVCESITLYDLLTESEEKIAKFMRNKALVLKFSHLSSKCGLTSYYRQCLRQRITRAIQIATLKDGATTILCKMIKQFYSASSVIVDKIIDYLSHEDLRKLYYIY